MGNSCEVKKRGAAAPLFGGRRLGRTQVDRRNPAALALFELVIQLLAFVEAVHAGPLDSGDVDENIRASARRLDEPVALLGIEPFDRAGRHQQELQLVRGRRTSYGGSTPGWVPKRIDGQLGKRKRGFSQDPRAGVGAVFADPWRLTL